MGNQHDNSGMDILLRDGNSAPALPTGDMGRVKPVIRPRVTPGFFARADQRIERLQLVEFAKGMASLSGMAFVLFTMMFWG